MKDGKFLTMAIESSCDETSVAVLADGREILSNVISSQIEIHTQFGGVVPEIASRHHLNNINAVTEQALAQANVKLDDIDLIGVTSGPGLIGALLIGVATAKAFALAKNKPLVGVHHIQGHISANYLQYPELEPPFMAFVLSGGHTNIIRVTDYNKCEVLGQTRDDAIGEAYDKVARVIGLGYPGGPKIDRIAKEGDPNAIEFKRVMLEKDSLDFSFSGIKTGVLNYVNTQRQAGKEINVADVAASFQQAVLDVVVTKAMKAAARHNEKRLVMAGGVASNSALRKQMAAACEKRGIKLYVPDPVLCTDNAAMIGCAAYYMYKAGELSDLSLDAVASVPL
jgi:N6-L-threonylcarbamoyladenine synthase